MVKGQYRHKVKGLVEGKESSTIQDEDAHKLKGYNINGKGSSIKSSINMKHKKGKRSPPNQGKS